jgi:integrase
VCNLKTASSNRILTICDALYDDFKKYYNEVSKYKIFNDDFFIFGNDKGLTLLAYKQAQRRKGKIANKAGVKEIRLHGFRHSCASFLVNNGTPVTMVSKYLGHSNSSETLNTYSHLFNTTSSEVINTINRARNTVEN